MKKTKYLQIFNYLLEFSKIRTKPVRDIDLQVNQYPEKVWLNDIPVSKYFQNIINGDFEQDEECWLKIGKPKEPNEPIFEELPQDLKVWLTPDSWLNEATGPELEDEITEEGVVKILTDFPGLYKLCEKYRNEQWIEDFLAFRTKMSIYDEEYTEYKSLEKVYKQFFKIYNKVQQFGEEYELVLGVGLLGVKGDFNRSKLFRHVLTQKVDIAFNHDGSDSSIQVAPNIGSSFQFETDFLIDQSDSFDVDSVVSAEKIASEYLEKSEVTYILNDESINSALSQFADRFHVSGSFNSNKEKTKLLTDRPVVQFAPALLFRKRNTRSFTSFYEEILKNLEEGDDDADIPLINDFIGVEEEVLEVDESGQEAIQTSFDQSDTIYFPKESNEEQFKIIEKARAGSKVLVQGPPGTGKSHTIANLICHLLANGKKVLITAYTKRALEVLKDKLPEQFRSLTVNLLSSDSSSHMELQESVNAINEEMASAVIGDYEGDIKRLKSELNDIREKISSITSEFLKVKEKNTRSIDINSNYQGTLTQIAEKIHNESNKFDWYQDNFIEVENNDINAELKTFVELTSKYKDVEVSVFNYQFPKLEIFPEPNRLTQYKSDLQILSERFSFNENYPIYNILEYERLNSELESLSDFYEQGNEIKLDFKEELILDLSHGKGKDWRQKLIDSVKLVEQLNAFDLKNIDRDIEIAYNCSFSSKQLRNDAQILLNFINSGKSLSGSWFKFKKPLLPVDIKERLYFIEAVRCNGSACDTKEELESVIVDLNIQQVIAELVDLWGISEKLSNSYSRQMLFFDELNKGVLNFMKLFDASELVRKKTILLIDAKIKPFDLIALKELGKAIDYNFLVHNKNRFEKTFAECKEVVGKDEIHPLILEMFEGIKELNVVSYEDNLFRYKEELNDYNNYQDYLAQGELLREEIPLLIEQFLKGELSEIELESFTEALLHKNAKKEVEKLLDGDYERQLIQLLSDCNDKEKELIAQLSSTLAWYHLICRLKSNGKLRQHLEAWVMAVKQITGDGRGKKSTKFKKIAQREMENCKDSIPCWIMPLYKVAETIRPQKDMFDYVIVDEASQLGADATFLLYLAKKIIIVGDDKQTSPEYVGVDSNIVVPLIKKHLSDFQFGEYLGIEFSFFDQAKLFCNGNMIVLREHFRCMPEIIEFSNKHFYAPEGNSLYPLKQYSEDRLTPLVAKFCENGYVENKGARIVNVPEAIKIVELISDLVVDPKYINKTIGIITLQGTQQAQIIENHLLQAIGETEFYQRKIICGNSASFQGDERDVIILSLVTAQKHNRSALVKPQDKRRFNVAMSRAIEQVFLFHSVQLEDLSNTNDLRYKLLFYFKNYKVTQPILSLPIQRKPGTQPPPFDSWFEVDVYNDIVRKGFQVIPQYKVAGGRFRIDLVALRRDGTKLAIECDGDKWHGPEQYQNDMMRQNVLERCNWQFFRVRGSEYYLSKEESLRPLWKLLEPKDKDVVDIECEDIKNEFSNRKNEVDVDSEINMDNWGINKPNLDSRETPDLFNCQNGFSVKPDYKLETIKFSEHFKLNTVCDVLIFTSKSNVYKLQNERIISNEQILSKVEFEEGEDPIFVTATEEYVGYLLLAFENGKMAKVSMSGYKTQTNRKRLKNAFSDSSKLLYIDHINADIDLIAIASNDKILLFNTADINSVKNTSSNGVQVLRLKSTSFLKEIRTSSLVDFTDLEYYRKNIPATGYYIVPGDAINKE
ncbi:AAA domain-containing protein [Labilibaculum antarcticum]|uniref:DNA helicase n=1 Tax=Labilibaculum antarcticum TaxID=1717717 RepID=A0A1Y1CKE9_9BACT|nr:AAA domain-containing protein [Labilibaculum antarcticum]BAX80825.1 hypothetical protein ALGA_2503 [Labilibaculum antarcticum]